MEEEVKHLVGYGIFVPPIHPPLEVTVYYARAVKINDCDSLS